MSMHITLIAAVMARISGVVIDSQGRPAAGAFLVLRSGSAMMMMAAMGGQVAADGSFAVRNVPPGEHVLDVRQQPRGPGAPMEFASVPITVAGDDVAGLRIVTGRGGLVRGRVVFEGTSPRTGGFGPLRVFTQGADAQQMPGAPIAMGGPSMANGIVADDGTFEIDGIGGRVFFRAATPPAWTLKAVLVAGEDVTDTAYEFRSAQVLDDVRVVLTDRLTELSGMVTDDAGRPRADYVLVVLPAEPREGLAASRYTRMVRPDQQGRYRVRGLPPGRYVVTAVESLEQGGEWNPEFQARARDAGRAVTLEEGERLALDLKMSSIGPT
jgi:hypothetical protein